MSAIAAIGQALRYDAVETMIMVPGSIGALYTGVACKLAALAAEALEVNDCAPESTRPTEYAMTVRPAK